MPTKFTLQNFLNLYSSNEQCLEKIKQVCYPDGITCTKCQKVTNHYKIKDRLQYVCSKCGTHLAPLSGTIFEKSSTPLTSWFYAMFVMTKTRSGISAKQLQRELGVTYKTAWRMFKQIRMLMAQTGGNLLFGDVEIDETFVGGRGTNRRTEWGPSKQKQVLMGIAQRKGPVYIKHIPDTSRYSLLTQIREHVDPKARIHTDEFASYKTLHKYGYLHEAVNHGLQEYVRGDIYTQNIENVWSHFKRGITGVYRIVSKKYLQAYADEYAFRYNNRKSSEQMFEILLSQVSLVSSLKKIA